MLRIHFGVDGDPEGVETDYLSQLRKTGMGAGRDTRKVEMPRDTPINSNVACIHTFLPLEY